MLTNPCGSGLLVVIVMEEEVVVIVRLPEVAVS
jgi:hypothetical protein